MKFLTIRQPWASLIAVGAKTIETRPFSTRYRGPLAIHAGASTKSWRDLNEPSLMEDRHPITEIENAFGWWHKDDEGRDVMISPWTDDGRNGAGELIRQPGIWTGPIPHAGPPAPADFLPLGAVVAVCDLVDVVPIFHIMDVIAADPRSVPVPNIQINGTDLATLGYGGEGWDDVSDQRSLGDFTPGRYAWLLDNVRAIDPVPMKGAQGLRDLPADVEAQL